MAISCTVFEIKRDIGRKTPIFHTPRLVFYLHDSVLGQRFDGVLPVEFDGVLPVESLAQNFNTNCPSP